MLLFFENGCEKLMVINEIKKGVRRFTVNSYVSSNETMNLLVTLCVKISAFIVIPLILFITFSIIMSISFNKSNIGDVNKIISLKDTIMFFSIPMIFFFGVLPVLYKIVIEKETVYSIGLNPGKNKFYTFSMLVFLVTLVVSILSVYNKTVGQIHFYTVVIQFLAVALSEELLIRGIILFELRKFFNDSFSIIVSSLIFAFVYHSNADMWINFLLRFGVSILV